MANAAPDQARRRTSLLGRQCRQGDLSVDGLDFALVRYLFDGTPNPNFAANGKGATRLSGTSDVVNALLLQPDGKIVAAGLAGPLGIFSHASVTLPAQARCCQQNWLISPRLRVQGGENVLIGRFIITGSDSEK